MDHAVSQDDETAYTTTIVLHSMLLDTYNIVDVRRQSSIKTIFEECPRSQVLCDFSGIFKGKVIKNVFLTCL